MTQEKMAVPAGYWRDGNEALIPVSKIKAIDKDRHKVVVDLCEHAKKASADLVAFKLLAITSVNEVLVRSLAEYDAKLGGK